MRYLGACPEVGPYSSKTLRRMQVLRSEFYTSIPPLLPSEGGPILLQSLLEHATGRPRAVPYCREWFGSAWLSPLSYHQRAGRFCNWFGFLHPFFLLMLPYYSQPNASPSLSAKPTQKVPRRSGPWFFQLILLTSFVLPISLTSLILLYPPT